MTIIRPLTLRCTECGHEWQGLEGWSTNTFGMSEEEARAHLDNFWKEYGQPEKKPCPECGSEVEKKKLQE